MVSDYKSELTITPDYKSGVTIVTGRDKYNMCSLNHLYQLILNKLWTYKTFLFISSCCSALSAQGVTS